LSSFSAKYSCLQEIFSTKLTNNNKESQYATSARRKGEKNKKKKQQLSLATS